MVQLWVWAGFTSSVGNLSEKRTQDSRDPRDLLQAQLIFRTASSGKVRLNNRRPATLQQSLRAEVPLTKLGRLQCGNTPARHALERKEIGGGKLNARLLRKTKGELQTRANTRTEYAVSGETCSGRRFLHVCSTLKTAYGRTGAPFSRTRLLEKELSRTLISALGNDVPIRLWHAAWK